MQRFMSTKEAAEKWNISQRRVSILCAENRIFGAMMVGNMWIIPREIEKPIDKRTIRYEKSKTIQLKPFIKWVGGKSQLISELEKHIPLKEQTTLTKYVEPFVGGGALLFNILSKYEFDNIYIGDINAELINAYKVIQKDVYTLIMMLSKIEEDFLSMDDEARKKYYYNARKQFNDLILDADTMVEKAVLFIFLNKTCFNGLYRVNKKGKFNVPMGAYKRPTICDRDNLIRIAEALQKVTIICGDYTLLSEYIDNETLVYLDPPYRPISETASFTSYNTTVFDDNEQVRLANYVDVLNDKGAKVILSNSDPKNVNQEDDFFEQLYSKYKIKVVEATRMINSNSNKRGKINELLISNY